MKLICNSLEYKQKLSNSMKQMFKMKPEVKNKMSISQKKRFLKKEERLKISAAVRAAFSTPESHEKLSKAIKAAWLQRKVQMLQKSYNTKKSHHTFNSSSIENLTYNLLLQIFLKEDIEHNLKPYKDARYPYNCDFYIKSLDLFIECNYHWTHGKEPFNENKKEHLDKLNVWKEKAKSSKFYQNAIYVWSVLDIRKRQYAMNNNLNWLCFYTIEEFKQWLNSLNDAIAIKCTQIKPD